jgi:putative redox protein
MAESNLRTVTMRWHSGLRFDGGQDGVPPMTIDSNSVDGPGAMATLLMALAGCTGADVVSILKKMQVDLQRCDITVTGRRAAEHPKRYLEIQLTFRIAGTGVDEAKARRAIDLSLSKYCSVTHSLNPDIPVGYELVLE